jgi:uncharacterized protein YggE
VDVKKRYGIISIVVALGVVAALLLPAALPKLQAQEEMEDDSAQRTINVSGTGRVSTQPDVAVVRLGVETEAEEAAAALEQNNTQMQAVMAALEEAGVAAEDIQTHVVRLNPRYEEPAQGATVELVGYRATNLVEVRTQDLDTLGELVDAAIQAGGNRVEGIQFEVSDPSDLLDQAREAAWNDALDKAEQLVDLSGAELGDVMTISESSRTPRPVVDAAMGAREAAQVPIAPGTQTIEVDVHVTWFLR